MIDLPPPTPVVEVVVSSEGMNDGVRATDALQVQTDFRLDSKNVYIGATYKNVARIDKNPEDGEAHAYIGARQTVAGFGVDGRATFKTLTGKGISDRSAVEFEGNASRDFGQVAATVGIEYSPNDFRSAGETFYARGDLSTPVTPTTTVSGGVGRGWGDNSATYTAYNVGVTQSLLKGVSADVRFFGTSDLKHVTAADLRNYDDRVVASVNFRF
jgi:uncharacterized protein (TIGR02001 family)